MSENVYSSFSQLALCEPGSFELELDERTSPYTVMAIHGGEIEPGTTDIARAIAGGTHSFYTFRGVKAHGNRYLRIACNLFDEPYALYLVRLSMWIVSVHGCETPPRDAYGVIVGGLADGLREEACGALRRAGFNAIDGLKPIDVHVPGSLKGDDRDDICNRGAFKEGLQLQLTADLRRELLPESGPPSSRFERLHSFSQTIRAVLSSHHEGRPPLREEG